MLAGSAQTRRSSPAFAIAAFTLSRRTANSALSKYGVCMIFCPGLEVWALTPECRRRAAALRRGRARSCRDLAVAEADRRAGGDRRELGTVEVAPAEDEGGGAAQPHLAGEEGARADRRRALGDEPLLDEEMRHGAVDLLLAQQHDLVDEAAAEIEGPAVVEADAAAQRIGERGHLLDGDGAAGGEALLHGGAARHRDADDADPGLRRLGGERDAAGEAAARHRHQDRREIGPL